MFFRPVAFAVAALAGVTHALRPNIRKLNLSLETTDNLRKLEEDLAFGPGDTALVITDPQNDFLSPDGVTWGVVGESVIEHHTVENIGRLFMTARDLGYLVFISPHYYYPPDEDWEFGGAVEELMHSIDMFDREDPLSLEGFEGSGADWLEEYKDFIDGDNVIVTSPHKIYGPQQNDLALQLRKRKIDRVILLGMSANLCVESHLRELLEQGFDVTVVTDATAAANIPELGDGYEAAMTNFRFIANAVVNTSEAIEAMGRDPSTVDFPVDRETKTRMILTFKGEAAIAGTLEEVNTRFGTNCSAEEAFGDSFLLGDFMGCFELPMLYPEDQTQVGTGVDCTWSVDGGVAGITYFDFDDCGLFVHSGLTSLDKFRDGLGNGPIVRDGPNVDRISGSTALDGSNTILVGQEGFLGVTGNVRMSGALHLTTEPAYFNYIWEVELDQERICGLDPDLSSSPLFTDEDSIADARAAPTISGEVGDTVVSEAQVPYVDGHALVKFQGKATAIGDLSDANALTGVEVTIEDAFDDSVTLGDFMGCHSVKMIDFLSENVVGTGIDCLWSMEGGAASVSYYKTDLGVIVNSCLTSLAPFADGVVNSNNPVLGDPSSSPDAVLMTGSFPSAVDADNFVAATGM